MSRLKALVGAVFALPMLCLAVWGVAPLMLWYIAWIVGMIAFFGTLALLVHIWRRHAPTIDGPLGDKVRAVGRILDIDHLEGALLFASLAFIIGAVAYRAFLA